jgi:preprotein translocase subunit SecA
MFETHPDPASAETASLTLAEETMAPVRATAVDPADPTTWAATSRNAPCPCGSGRKFKHCHGRLA